MSAFDPLNDPRHEGLDSQSLPDRSAHPDPSRFAEFGDPKETPSHGIYGYLENKHGLVPDEELRRDRARGAQATVEALEAEQAGLKIRADGGDERSKQRLKGIDASLKHYRGLAKGHDEDTGKKSLAEAIIAGEVVPSVEDATPAESTGEGKVSEVRAPNAPRETK